MLKDKSNFAKSSYRIIENKQQKKKNRKGGEKKANIELVQQKGRMRKQRSRQNVSKKSLSSDCLVHKSTCSLSKTIIKA